MNRKLDGCFFRVKRDDKWQNVCFSDLTEDERDELFESKDQRSALWWKSLAYHLADRLKMIGDELDLMCE
jgi:hypothetical protein